MTLPATVKIRTILNAAVIISALGYFVDIYDLVLFSIVRVASLKDIGVSDDNVLSTGVFLLNLQMLGMLVGGILWGILGDKRGRVSVLFGSIFLYSTANILNAFVVNVSQYGILRFLAGIGLAGELGAAITLVTEIMPRNGRGYGTTIVASVGFMGAVLAGFIAQIFSWKIAFLLGGALGLLLLFLRMQTLESGIFQAVKNKNISRGNFLILFKSMPRFRKYISTILIGLPIWFVLGILITFSPELAKELGVVGSVQAGKAVLYCYIGGALGDIASGLLSQIWQSRKKAIAVFLSLTAFAIFLYNFNYGISTAVFYSECLLLGLATGYWVMFVTCASEQFGTNIRATVTTTVPNFIRGSVLPVTLLFRLLHQSYQFSLTQSALTVGVACLIIAFFALYNLRETFGCNLDYTEDEFNF